MYLEPYNSQPDHPWKLLEGSGAYGVSHIDRASATSAAANDGSARQEARRERPAPEKTVIEARDGRVRLERGANVLTADRIVVESGGRVTAEGGRPAEAGAPWGEAVEGVQVRLRPAVPGGMRLASGYVGEKIRFGPVVERELHAPQFIDFATGRLVTPPADLDLGDRAALLRWARKTDADARFVFDRGTRKMQFVDIWMAYVDDKDPDGYWNRLAPEALRKSLMDGWWASERSRLSAEEEARLREKNRVPAPSVLDENLPGLVHVFMMHNGHALGMLQVTGFTENPPGVKIRYRLLVTKEDAKPRKDAPPKEEPSASDAGAGAPTMDG
ncbi:MAG: hypothetical protein U9R68_02455 [Planctomycetota bacterium]|nr:hypothetical protein [Planctomycetota bacterium]